MRVFDNTGPGGTSHGAFAGNTSQALTEARVELADAEARNDFVAVRRLSAAVQLLELQGPGKFGAGDAVDGSLRRHNRVVA